MIKSKLGAIAFVAAIGLASPALAEMPNAISKGQVSGPSSLYTLTPVANYGASATGGGSAGYNHGVASDYRLKQHRVSPRVRDHHNSK